MDKADIPFLTATDLSRVIKDKEVSPVEAVEAYLERIELLNPKLHAYLTVTSDQALQAARASEQELAKGHHRGDMHGVPIAVKDQLRTKGIRTTAGTPIFSDYVPDEDATVISKLQSAGAILLGKLNMTEFGTTGFSHSFITARNPWDLERFTGGSSSGSGAATAAFLCATSLGEDTGGSVRFPATWCGLVGLRPSWGRVSRYGVITGVWSMDAIGPLSRTVEDCAMTMETIAGHDPKDPYTWDQPVPGYRKSLNGDIKNIKVGVVKEQLYSEQVEPEIRDSVSKAISVLGELGASVEELSIPFANHASMISRSLRIEAATRYKDLVRDRLGEISHDNRIGYLVGNILPSQVYYKAQKLRTLLRQEVLEALNKVDVLVCPTAGVAAQKIEPDPVVDSKAGSSRLEAMLTVLFSLASIPALSIPCGFTSENLPIGLQIAGRPFEEQTLFNVAYAYEQNTPWHTKKLPI